MNARGIQSTPHRVPAGPDRPLLHSSQCLTRPPCPTRNYRARCRARRPPADIPTTDTFILCRAVCKRPAKRGQLSFPPLPRLPATIVCGASQEISRRISRLPTRLSCVARIEYQSGDALFRHNCALRKNWRRGWDLNPRIDCSIGGFQGRCIKPLCHLSTSVLEFQVQN